MRVIAIAVLAIILLVAGICAAEETLPFEIRHYGNFKRMMHTGNVEAVVGLEQALSGGHIYAVGAIWDAGGEITVYDGNVYLSYGRDGIDTVVRDVPEGEQAMLLITAGVEEWREIAVPTDMPDHELYLFMLSQAEKNGLSKDAPFPFLIEGLIRDIQWHVMDGVAPESERHGEHSFIRKLIDRQKDIPANLVGFYSAGSQGVFTHPGESYHTHVVFDSKGMAGHVESFSVAGGAVLKLPIR